jgi:hypothetical protein
MVIQVQEEPEPDDPEQPIKVKFMQRTPEGLWPESADIGDQPVNDIICPVEPLTVINKRLQFKFDDAVFKHIQEQISDVKSTCSKFI